MKKKLISIIINCHNGEKYLHKTLESILHQKYKNYEVIFVDNFSKDSSAEIFKKIQDKRFKYFKTKKKIRLYEGRNFALKKCKGEFITFLDADDWWEKDFLLSKNKFFRSSNDYGFCFSNCMHFYENKEKYKVFYSKKMPSGFILEDLLKFYFVKMSTIIFKKRLIQSLKFNPRYNIIGDYDLIIRAAKKIKGMGFQDNLANIRIHKTNFSHNNRKMFYEEFKHWINNQDFSNFYFNQNREFLFDKLEYLRLVYLLLEHKNFGLLLDIIKFPQNFYKIKLLIIFFIPNFILRLKKEYF